jgi:hypothetical protein
VGSFQGDENQAGRQRGHRQEPGSGRRADRCGRENGRRGRDPADDLAGADRTTDDDPATDKTDAGDGAAMAFGEPAPARLPRTADPVPISEKVRSPTGEPGAHARIPARSARTPRRPRPADPRCLCCVPPFQPNGEGSRRSKMFWLCDQSGRLCCRSREPPAPTESRQLSRHCRQVLASVPGRGLHWCRARVPPLVQPMESTGARRGGPDDYG